MKRSGADLRKGAGRVGRPAKTGRPHLSASEPDQTYNPQTGTIVVSGHFDAITGLSTVTDAPSLTRGVTGPGAALGETLDDIFNVHIVDRHLFRVETAALKQLQNFSDDEIHALVVPKRTLARRVAEGEPLTVEETDKAVRLARVDKLAARVFGDRAKASRWLRKPKASLGGQTPLSYLATEAGARAVEEMLNGIDHGIFA